jgi:hypothetical protein
LIFLTFVRLRLLILLRVQGYNHLGADGAEMLVCALEKMASMRTMGLVRASPVIEWILQDKLRRIRGAGPVGPYLHRFYSGGIEI